MEDQDVDSLDDQDNCPTPKYGLVDQDHDGRGDSCDDEPNTPNYRFDSRSTEPLMPDGAAS